MHLLVSPKRKPASQPPAIDRILAERRLRNLRVWKEFNARDLQTAWHFVFGVQCSCPPLDTEPQKFRELLGMRSTQHELKSDLEIAVSQKYDGETPSTPWRDAQ